MQAMAAFRAALFRTEIWLKPGIGCRDDAL